MIRRFYRVRSAAVVQAAFQLMAATHTFMFTAMSVKPVGLWAQFQRPNVFFRLIQQKLSAPDKTQ